jgi:hypothetical protein
MTDFLSLQINRLQRQKDKPFLEVEEKGRLERRIAGENPRMGSNKIQPWSRREAFDWKTGVESCHVRGG